MLPRPQTSKEQDLQRSPAKIAFKDHLKRSLTKITYKDHLQRSPTKITYKITFKDFYAASHVAKHETRNVTALVSVARLASGHAVPKSPDVIYFQQIINTL